MDDELLPPGNRLEVNGIVVNEIDLAKKMHEMWHAHAVDCPDCQQDLEIFMPWDDLSFEIKGSMIDQASLALQSLIELFQLPDSDAPKH